MSEMDFEPDMSEGALPPGVQRLQNSLIEFTGCISDALPDVCSVGFTLGEAYVPFDPDPDEGCKANDVQCSQGWVRAMNVQPKSGSLEGWDGQDCALTLMLDIEVGVLRCIKIPAKGLAPKATDVLVAGFQALTDMNSLLCAALGCEVWDSITVGAWSPSGPSGGQYGGTWTFTVEL